MYWHLHSSIRSRASARDEALPQGITINDLVILSERSRARNAQHTNPPGGLANYCRTNVIGVPGAFVMKTNDFNSFDQAFARF